MGIFYNSTPTIWDQFFKRERNKKNVFIHLIDFKGVNFTLHSPFIESESSFSPIHPPERLNTFLIEHEHFILNIHLT